MSQLIFVFPFNTLIMKESDLKHIDAVMDGSHTESWTESINTFIKSSSHKFPASAAAVEQHVTDVMIMIEIVIT